MDGGRAGTGKNMAEGCKKGNLPVPVLQPASSCALFWPSRRRRSPALESTRIWPQSMPCPVLQSSRFGRMVRVCAVAECTTQYRFFPPHSGMEFGNFGRLGVRSKLDKSSPDLGWKTLRVVGEGPGDDGEVGG